MATHVVSSQGQSEPSGRDLALLDVPKGDRLRVEDAGRLDRLYANRRWRGRAPMEMSLALGWAIGLGSWWLVSKRRELHRHRAAHLLEEGAASPRVARLARSQLVEHAIQHQLIWRPERFRSMPIEGLEHLERARRDGKGVIFTGSHFGPPYAILHALASTVGRLYVVSDLGAADDQGEAGREAEPAPPGWQWRPESRPLRGRHGLVQLTMLRSAEESGCRWLNTGRSYAVLRALLLRGDACRINFDLVGRTPTRVGGRRFMLASGVARLAREVDVPIVPAWAFRDGRRMYARLLPAIEPGRFPDLLSLQDHVAAVVDEVVTAHPAQARTAWPPGQPLPGA